MARYSQEEKQFIIDNSVYYNDEELAKMMSLHFNKQYTKQATRKKRQRLGVQKSGYRGHFKVEQHAEN